MDQDFVTHRQGNYLFIFLLAISILLLTTHVTEYVRGIKNFLFYILMPAPSSAARLVNANQKISATIGELVSVHRQNVELTRQLERFSSLENDYRQVIAENARLRALVSFTPPAQKKTLAAQVVLREPGSWFQWLVINRGKSDGVIIDSPVIVWTDDGPAVLGRVGELFEHSAKVVLISSVLSALPAMSADSQDDGLLEGQNGGTMKLSYLAANGKIAVGDKIVTSPLSAIFPAGIAVGKVLRITPSSDAHFQSAHVEPRVNFNALREVTVLVTD
ncbi:MAG: rod shape-determining protein MreC [Elusimicrobia bacterium RIFOXYA2_FULL_50_26]|nr:MAG: rod shape-determining protein MreC [Elusimicrobia bacterium RIFOXYA2_FULL_50_26]